jgi:hypothetical protein
LRRALKTVQPIAAKERQITGVRGERGAELFQIAVP